MKPPKELDRIVDKVLAYKVPARSPKAKKRQRKRRKVQRESVYKSHLMNLRSFFIGCLAGACSMAAVFILLLIVASGGQ